MNDRHRQHLTMPSINTLKSGISTQSTQTEQMNADFYGLIIIRILRMPYTDS